MCIPRVSAHPFLTQGGYCGQVLEASQRDMKPSLYVATHMGFPHDGSNPDCITREQFHIGRLGVAKLKKAEMATWSFSPHLTF